MCSVRRLCLELRCQLDVLHFEPVNLLDQHLFLVGCQLLFIKRFVLEALQLELRRLQQLSVLAERYLRVVELGLYINMCRDMCVGLCLGICICMSVDMHIDGHVYRHVNRHHEYRQHSHCTVTLYCGTVNPP